MQNEEDKDTTRDEGEGAKNDDDGDGPVSKWSALGTALNAAVSGSTG